MRREIALLGLAVLAFALFGCASAEEEISPPSQAGAEESALQAPPAASGMGITEEDLSVSGLDIEMEDDGFSTDLPI